MMAGNGKIFGGTEPNLIVIDHGKGRDANWVLFVVHCEFMEFSLRGRALIDCPGFIHGMLFDS